MCQTQRDEIFKLENEKFAEHKEKENLKTSLNETMKKLDFANENYKELQALIRKNALLNQLEEKSAENLEKTVKKVSLSISEQKEDENDQFLKIKTELFIKEQENSHLRFENNVYMHKNRIY